MSFKKILRPDAPVKPIEDEEEVKREYKAWRWRIFSTIYMGYALFYFTRLSFDATKPALMDSLGYTKSDLGILVTLLAVSYGVSKFVSGVFSDKSNLRYFMGLGLIMTGVFNIFFGFSSNIVLFGFFLVMNGLFQGWGSPSCAKVLTYWYSQKERGRWWGFWNTSHNVGTSLIFIICPIIVSLAGWRMAMHIPGILAICYGFVIIKQLRGQPSAVGLPSIEKFRNDYPDEQVDDEPEKKLSSKELLSKYILKNRYIWILAISFFFVYTIRLGMTSWILLYLMEAKGYTLLKGGFCVFWFEIGGIFGSLAAGWLSDTVFNGRRAPVNILFCLGIVFALFALWAAPHGNLSLISMVMFSVGFLIFGPQLLIGMAAAEMVDKRAAGSATGFVGFFAYLGGATAGWPIGKVTEEYGWSGFFIFLSVCAVVVMTLLIPLWSKSKRPQLATPA